MQLAGDHFGNSRTTVRNDILVPFISETILTLESMADLKASSDLLTYQDALDTFIFKGFSVCLVTRRQGEVDGKIVMNHDLATALAIGNRVRAKMLGTEENATTLNAEVSEALAEFANTAIGLAIRHLSATRKFSFGTPAYIISQADSQMFLEGVKQIFTVPVDLAVGGRFYFSYLMHGEG
ncbi:MAG: chemotaxis protein CheX [Pseudomonadota bacterium]